MWGLCGHFRAKWPNGLPRSPPQTYHTVPFFIEGTCVYGDTLPGGCFTIRPWRRRIARYARTLDPFGNGSSVLLQTTSGSFFHNNLRTVSAKIKDFDDLGMGQAYFYKQLRVVIYGILETWVGCVRLCRGCVRVE